MPRSPCPDWPALMDLATAAAYLTLGPGTAASLLRRENVAPIVVAARLKRWRREDLDALVQRLAGQGIAGEGACQAMLEGFDWALAAVERRARSPRSERGGSGPRRPDEVRQPRPAP
ncbi:hypothetical protein [Phenylobacterium deserti]|uniref:Uncharacterized protein n=1 Tax=Phenylobacterium deserti TaxID=1914756 RepID=A0A328ACS4_9CAUL|nr:hypothetical protein [Phenylobacterium deserti]RAK52613.1 hypothetical protein DJ018_10435 [Phenylobacterium deserti]